MKMTPRDKLVRSIRCEWGWWWGGWGGVQVGEVTHMYRPLISK